MDDDVAKVLGSKNICLREAMLKSLQYGDMGVVEELKEGSELVGCVEKTGIWPMKFQPAMVRISELQEEVWTKTLEEVQTGSLVGPLDLCFQAVTL